MTAPAGLVLAGGYSRRFGDEEKALAEIDGRPMLEHVVDRIGRVTQSVVVSCRDEQRDTFRSLQFDPEVEFVTDPVPDRGPVVGIETALATMTAESVAIVACDMPGVDPSFLRTLSERLPGHDAVVPRLPSGHVQPLQAVYRTRPMETACRRQRLASDVSLRAVLDRLDVLELPPDVVAQHTDWRSLVNVNTADELDIFLDGDEAAIHRLLGLDNGGETSN